MLTLTNLRNIEGKEFQLSSGKRFLIGMARDEGAYYSFGVFPMKNGVASIKDAIVYRLGRGLRNRRGYELTNSLTGDFTFVKWENLTLTNFVLELHIQTAQLC